MSTMHQEYHGWSSHPVGEKKWFKHVTVERRVFVERFLYHNVTGRVHRQSTGVFQRQHGLVKVLHQHTKLKLQWLLLLSYLTIWGKVIITMHVNLHWLNVPERVKFKLVSMVHNCLHHKAPRYLMDHCILISDVASRRHLHSARRHYLVVPRHSLSSYGRRTFAVASPTAWNSLSDDLHDPSLSTDSFRRLLKTRLFSEY